MGSQWIYWTTFSWEAFAALVTGLAAVIAARNIGLKQVEILDRQAAIQEQSLRSDLFEKRFHVYQRVRNLFEFAMFNNSPASQELHSAYFQAMIESRFLFDDKVYKYLVDIRTKIGEYDYVTMEREDVERTARGDVVDCNNKITVIHRYFADELAKLPDIFHELKIEKCSN